MRVRDYCRKSMEFLVGANYLPGYQISGPFDKGVPRRQAVFLPEHMILAHYAIAEGALYADRAAWDAAYRYIRSFTAAGIGGGKSIVFPQWCGKFPNLDAGDLLGMISSAMTQSGMVLKYRNDTAHTASFEAIDDCKVSGLPEPYGKYLQLVLRRAGWDNPVQLRLLANVRAVALPLAPGAPAKFESYLELETSTLAPPLMESAANRLAMLLPVRLQARQASLATMAQASLVPHAAALLPRAPAAPGTLSPVLTPAIARPGTPPPPKLYPVKRRP
jgi:hypothetical protein